MSSLGREIVFLILQFLDEEKFKDSVHKIEQESGFFFNSKYFEDEVLNGNWDEVERYLSGFTKMDDNEHSSEIFFEIRKQKYFEALDNHDHSKAVDILVKDLKVFAPINEEVFKKLTRLLTLKNFREYKGLRYGETKDARVKLFKKLKELIEENPLFHGKLQFPNFKNKRLWTLINQSLNWQHHFCKDPRPNPNIKTLFVDHNCGQPGAPDDLPKTVARTLDQGSCPMSMDFHPGQQTLLLVGTDTGDIGLWKLGSGVRLVVRNFKTAKTKIYFNETQVPPVEDPGVSVNRVTWSPDGSLFGVAFSRNIVQIYSYHGGDDVVQQHLEIDAHVGGVNDLAFSHPNRRLCVVTCGDDKIVKVWDAVSGAKKYTFEGHEATVHSVCPFQKKNKQFIFSTALDGDIKAWKYNEARPKIDHNAPGHWRITLAYSADGSRLFSCGTSRDGQSHILEWNDGEGTVKRTYQGFSKHSSGVVQFDTTRNRYLAAGDEFSVKFWDMDNDQLLMKIDADGCLPARPRIRFNKDGTLLAVSANDNGIKILANIGGIRLLNTLEILSFDTSRVV